MIPDKLDEEARYRLEFRDKSGRTVDHVVEVADCDEYVAELEADDGATYRLIRNRRLIALGPTTLGRDARMRELAEA